MVTGMEFVVFPKLMTIYAPRPTSIQNFTLSHSPHTLPGLASFKSLSSGFCPTFCFYIKAWSMSHSLMIQLFYTVKLKINTLNSCKCVNKFIKSIGCSARSISNQSCNQQRYSGEGN